MILVPFPDDFDPYGRDLSKTTSGQDNVYRFHCNAKGVYRVTCLSEAEAKEYRETNKPIDKPRKRERKSA